MQEEVRVMSMGGFTVPLLWREESHRSCCKTSTEESPGEGGERRKIQVERTGGTSTARTGPGKMAGESAGDWAGKERKRRFTVSWFLSPASHQALLSPKGPFSSEQTRLTLGAGTRRR